MRFLNESKCCGAPVRVRKDMNYCTACQKPCARRVIFDDDKRADKIG